MAQKENGKSNLLYLLIAILIFAAVYSTFFNNEVPEKLDKVVISEIQANYQNGEVTKIEIRDSEVIATLRSGEKQVAIKGADETAKDLGFTEFNDVELEYVDTAGSRFWSDLAISLIPFFLVILFLFVMMRSVSGANRTALSFGLSKARQFEKKEGDVTFADVAGAESAKEELKEVVDFLKFPKKYLKLGARIPKGVLLFGAPGTGKTLMARAVAGEANVPFFSISGSEFVEMFVGVGASRVRDMFAKARKNAPCIVFIDEIDAVGRHRGAGLGGGHDEREQTLNQILTEMDGFEKDTNVIVVAATNRPDVLDPALLRPGRFDRRVTVDMPDVNEREEILKVHAREKPMAKKADLNVIARHTPGFAGADLENLMNEAAIKAAREDKKSIDHVDLERSIEKIALGPERRSKILTPEEMRITAFHEVGHAIAGHVVPNTDPMHKISIVSRGSALGVTWFLPEKDEVLTSQPKFEDQLVSLLGGHVSEKLTFGQVTTGASNDLEKASQIARNMVTKFGMSKLGPIIFGSHHGNVFLGKDLVHERNYSEETQKLIDDAVSEIMGVAYKRCEKILSHYKNLLKVIAEELLKKETLTREEFLEYFKGVKIMSV